MFTARHKGEGGVQTTPVAEGVVNTVGGSDTSHWEPVLLGLWLGVMEGDAPVDSDEVGDGVLVRVLEGVVNTAHDIATLPSAPLKPVAPPPAAPVV
jgi:hypothetical protein